MIASIFVLAAAAATPIAEPPLKPWEALVGHCWAGPAPGNHGIDKHCFESVYGGQHVRDRHVVTVDGRIVYEGEALYSAKGQQVIFTYWNTIGGLGTGTADLAGGNWRFAGTIHATATSPEQPMAAVWTMQRDGYEVDAEGGPPRRFKRAD
jgi:hypothetical protein